MHSKKNMYAKSGGGYWLFGFNFFCLWVDSSEILAHKISGKQYVSKKFCKIFYLGVQNPLYRC